MNDYLVYSTFEFVDVEGNSFVPSVLERKLDA